MAVELAPATLPPAGRPFPAPLVASRCGLAFVSRCVPRTKHPAGFLAIEVSALLKDAVPWRARSPVFERVHAVCGVFFRCRSVHGWDSDCRGQVVRRWSAGGWRVVRVVRPVGDRWRPQVWVVPRPQDKNFWRPQARSRKTDPA